MTEKLAINGGTPVRTTPMPKRAAMGIAERRAVYECLAFYNEYIADPGYQGEYERRYTDAFCAYMGGGYADAVATGTAALYVAIAALRLPRDSHVLVSSITDPGTFSAIILNGLHPKLVDTMPSSYNIGLETILPKMDRKVSAIVLVHAAGQAAPGVDRICKYAREHGIRVVEDCSQAHGAKLDGQKVGTFGDIAAFSTMYRKAHMTGGSGGVVFTRDRSLYHMALAYADRGKPRWQESFDDRNPKDYLFPALNLHTDEISCAIGCASLMRMDGSIQLRRAYCAGVKMELMEHSEACRAVFDMEDSPFFLPITVKGIKAKIFAEAVLAEGIPLNPRYAYCADEWPWLSRYLVDEFYTTNASAMIDCSFNLYLNENYREDEVRDTVAAILKVERLFHG